MVYFRPRSTLEFELESRPIHVYMIGLWPNQTRPSGLICSSVLSRAKAWLVLLDLLHGLRHEPGGAAGACRFHQRDCARVKEGSGALQNSFVLEQ